MGDLPDIEGLSQQIADLHLQGDLILHQPVGKHIRRVTIAQLKNAPDMGPPHYRLSIGGRKCHYIELVANVPIIDAHDSVNTGVRFTLNDGFGIMSALLPPEHPEKEKQKACIASLRPFDYAHFEGKVHRFPGCLEPVLEIISVRRVQSPYEIFLHLLQALAEINETIRRRNDEEIPESASAMSGASPVKALATKRKKSARQKTTRSSEMQPDDADDEYYYAPAVGGGGTRDRKGKTRAVLGREPSTPVRGPQRADSSVLSETPTKLRKPPPKSTPTKTPAALRRHPMYLGAHVLRYFRHNYSVATSENGIKVDNNILEYLQQNTVDMSLEDLKEALENLMEQKYIYQTIDEFHYALVT